MNKIKNQTKSNPLKKRGQCQARMINPLPFTHPPYSLLPPSAENYQK